MYIHCTQHHFSLHFLLCAMVGRLYLVPPPFMYFAKSVIPFYFVPLKLFFHALLAFSAVYVQHTALPCTFMPSFLFLGWIIHPLTPHFLYMSSAVLVPFHLFITSHFLLHSIPMLVPCHWPWLWPFFYASVCCCGSHHLPCISILVILPLCHTLSVTLSSKQK